MSIKMKMLCIISMLFWEKKRDAGVTRQPVVTRINLNRGTDGKSYNYCFSFSVFFVSFYLKSLRSYVTCRNLKKGKKMILVFKRLLSAHLLRAHIGGCAGIPATKGRWRGQRTTTWEEIMLRDIEQAAWGHTAADI